MPRGKRTAVSGRKILWGMKILCVGFDVLNPFTAVHLKCNKPSTQALSLKNMKEAFKGKSLFFRRRGRP